MNNEDYTNAALRTEAPISPELLLRMVGCARLNHAAIGLCTEVGELQDALKKHIFYGKDLDRVNLAEEAGDLFYYLAVLCDELNVDISSVMATNIAKLTARYPEKFTEHHAEHRDLETERKILEQ